MRTSGNTNLIGRTPTSNGSRDMQFSIPQFQKLKPLIPSFYNSTTPRTRITTLFKPQVQLTSRPGGGTSNDLTSELSLTSLRE
ncbi:hypothetical protein M8J75_007402 [Diaphorina citri]|nr:hypothetical protein M8J75_007402 [Diaphorina citri]